MDLENIPLEKLEQEIKRRRYLAAMAIERERAQMEDAITTNVSVLLKLVPKHTRTGCSDENPINDTRCTRCELLDIQRDHFMNPERSLVIYFTNYERTPEEMQAKNELEMAEFKKGK